MTPEQELKEQILMEEMVRQQWPSLPVDYRQRYVEKDGWEPWLRRYFPTAFNRPFARYQKTFWDWGWQLEPNVYYRPRVECEPRGVGKSTSAETLVVQLLARKRKKAIGYVSGTDVKATKHFNSIRRKLENADLLIDYPHLKPQVQKYRNAFNSWSQDRLVTDGRQMLIPITLQGSNRGFKSDDDTRFDMIVLDDIDSLGESPDVIAKNLELLKSEIIFAGYAYTTILFAQNLIHRDSICSMVMDYRADMLSDRDFKGPYPLMKWYDAERIELPDGGRPWKITAGEPFDDAISQEYAEVILNQIGRDLFDREAQQDVTKVGEDKDFREWDEVYHIVTRSEIIKGFERVSMSDANGFFIPPRWKVGQGFDWGTTRDHPASITFVARPDKTCPHDDCHFVFSEVVMPCFPYDPSIAAELVSPGRIAAKIRETEHQFRLQKGQVAERKMSHEASAARNTLIVDLPEDLKTFFNKWRAQRGSGVPQIQNLLEIDKTKPHPFRRYPKGHPDAGKPLIGRPRIYFIVADGQGELYVDDNGKLRVTGATSSEGLARCRYEMPIYSHRNTGQKKIDDDFVDSFRGLMSTFGVPAGQLTVDEKIENALPATLRRNTIDSETDPNKKYGLVQARLMKERAVRQKITKHPTKSPLRRFRDIFGGF